MFTRLIGTARSGFKGTALDVVYAVYAKIEDVHLAVRPNGIPVLGWRQYYTTGGAAYYVSTWKGTYYGGYGYTNGQPDDVSIISNSVAGHGDIAINPSTGWPAIVYPDSTRKFIWREYIPGTGWRGHNGAWYDIFWSDLPGNYYRYANRAQLDYDLQGHPRCITAGDAGQGVSANVGHRMYVNGVWKGAYTSGIDTLPIKAVDLVDTEIDAYGRLQVVSQWESAANGYQVAFCLTMTNGWGGLDGRPFDWVSAPNAMFPAIDSAANTVPFVIMMDPATGNTVISYWHWDGFKGYMGGQPTNVTTDANGQWGGTYARSSNKGFVIVTTCTQVSATCAYGRIDYAHEQ